MKNAILILVACIGMVLGGCEFDEMVGDYNSSDSGDTETENGNAAGNGTASVSDTALRDENDDTLSVPSSDSETGVAINESDVDPLDIEALPVTMDICSARVSQAGSSWYWEKYNPLLLNNDLEGYTFIGNEGMGISPFNVEEPEIVVAADLELFRPLMARSSDNLVYGLTVLQDEQDDKAYVSALSMDDGSTVWQAPFPRRFDHVFTDVDGSGSGSQEAVVTSHPDGGIIVIGAFNDEFVLDEGKPSEITLQTSGDNYAPFMAHYDVDGTLVSARVLDTKVVPDDIHVMQKEDGQWVCIVQGKDYTLLTAPESLVMLTLTGDTLWETSVYEPRAIFDDDFMEGAARHEPVQIIPGISGTFYVAMSVWDSVVFVGTDEKVIETEQPGFVKKTATGETRDSQAIVLAQYDMDGHLLMATLPKVGPFAIATYPPSVIYQNDLILILGRQQSDNVIRETYPNTEALTGIPDMQAFVAAYNPEDMSLQGLKLLPESIYPGSLVQRDDEPNTAMAYVKAVETIFFEEPVLQSSGLALDELEIPDELNGGNASVIMEICSIVTFVE